MRVPKAANEAEIMVFTIDRATADASPWLLIASCDPPLKARNPKKRINPPKAAICENIKQIITNSDWNLGFIKINCLLDSHFGAYDSHYAQLVLKL